MRLTRKTMFGDYGLEATEWDEKTNNKMLNKLGRYEDKGEPEELTKVVRCGKCKQFGNGKEGYGECRLRLKSVMAHIDEYCSFGEEEEL